MTTRLYSATHRQWDHTGAVHPEVEHSESHRPAAELKPADWLPVVRQDSKFEDWVVIMPGKVVSLDRQGNVCPAGYYTTFQTNTAITYTANDYTAGTIDITTGAAYAVNGSTTYTQANVTTGLQNRGLITSTEYALDFISRPIGYAPYAYLQWCGGDGWNPAEFNQHNYNRQHQVAVGCDYVLQIPMVPCVLSSENTAGAGAIANTAIVQGTQAWKSSTGIAATGKYASLVSAGDDIVAYVFDHFPVAKQTANTPFTCTGLSSLTELTSIADVLAHGLGHYYVDYDYGVLFIWRNGGASVPPGFNTTITYYRYDTTTCTSANHAMVLGDIHPGDFLMFDSQSNYIESALDIGTAPNNGTGGVYAADPDYSLAADAAISRQIEQAVSGTVGGTVAQVLAIQTWPRSALDKVRTQFSGLGTEEKMPGSATSGYSDSLTWSGGANKVAIINFIGR